MMVRKIWKITVFILIAAMSVLMVLSIGGNVLISIATFYLLTVSTVSKGIVALVYSLFLILLAWSVLFKIDGFVSKISFFWSTTHSFYFLMVVVLILTMPPPAALSYVSWQEVEHLGVFALFYYPLINLLSWMANLFTDIFTQIKPLIAYSAAFFSIIFGLLSGMILFLSKRKAKVEHETHTSLEDQSQFE